MILTVKLPAGPYELFSRTAADNMPGRAVNCKSENGDVGVGQIMAAEVVENGRALALTIDWPDDDSILR